MPKDEVKKDIVYILGDGSKWYDNEIKYSIRSVEKNLKNYGRIFIVGKWPRHIDSKKVTYIEARDPGTHKLLNAIHKISIACHDKRLSQEFILMNDDFFVLKEVEEIKGLDMGTLEQAVENHKTKAGYYYKATKETDEYLKAKGIEKPMSYELHYPMVLDKDKFLEVTEDLYLNQKPLLFRSVYGNLCKIPTTYADDVKIYALEEIAKVENEEIVSTDNRVCLEKEMQKWLGDKFPKKSKYEKGV